MSDCSDFKIGFIFLGFSVFRIRILQEIFLLKKQEHFLSPFHANLNFQWLSEGIIKHISDVSWILNFLLCVREWNICSV